MKASDYADLLSLDQGARADWTKLSNYASHESWSYRRWAWEFLRRNPFYQRDSHKTGPMSQASAWKYGRENMKNYRATYKDEEDALRCWLPEFVVDMDACHSPAGKSVTYDLERGEVALVFDLRRVVSGGRAAMRSMIANATLDLYSELEKFENSLLRAGDRVPKIIKPRPVKLLLRLRMCDAMWKRATDEELMRVFYPGNYLKGSSPTPERRAQTIRKIREDQRAAIQLMESGYLELVPLDYLAVESLKP